MMDTKSAFLDRTYSDDCLTKNAGMENAAHLSHMVQHLYIGAAPLLFPLIMGDLGITFMMIGILISVRTFFAGFFQIFYGHLTRAFSRRTIMNGTNIVSLIATIGLGLSHFFAPFLFFNVLWGLSTAPIHPVGGALLADTPKTHRSKKRGFNIGLFYSYAYIGNLVGALIATGFVATIGWQGVFFVIAALTFPVCVYGLLVKDAVSTPTTKSKNATAELLEALRNPKVILACLVGLFFFGGTNVFIRHLVPLYLTTQLHLPLEQSSWIFIGVSVIGIFAPPLFSAISARTDRKAVLAVLALALAITFVILPGQDHLSLVVIAVLGVMSLLAWPLLALLQAFLVEVLDPHLKSAGGDLLLTVNICSFILWGSLFGFLIDLGQSFDTTLRLIAGLCLVSVPLLVLIRERKGAGTSLGSDDAAHSPAPGR